MWSIVTLSTVPPALLNRTPQSTALLSAPIWKPSTGSVMTGGDDRLAAAPSAHLIGTPQEMGLFAGQELRWRVLSSTAPSLLDCTLRNWLVLPPTLLDIYSTRSGCGTPKR